MTDEFDQLDGVDSRLLSRVMAIDLPSAGWTNDDLGHILAHQLQAPLLFDLEPISRVTGRDVAGLVERTRPRAHSFADLLHHPSAPLELLQLAKKYAQGSRADPDGPLPPEVATLLYFACIAAALLRHGQRITTMDDPAIRNGLEWACQQPWVDGRTAELFGEGLSHLGESAASK